MNSINLFLHLIVYTFYPENISIKFNGFMFELFIIHIVYENNQNYTTIISFKTIFYLEKEGDRRRTGHIRIVYGITGLAKCKFRFAKLITYTDTMRMHLSQELFFWKGTRPY